jgi:hypothetical protein
MDLSIAAMMQTERPAAYGVENRFMGRKNLRMRSGPVGGGSPVLDANPSPLHFFSLICDFVVDLVAATAQSPLAQE